MSELTEQDREDLRAIGINPDAEPTERSLLAIWTDVLGNVEKSGQGKIPINVALKVIGTWPFLSFKDTARYHELYHEVLGEGRDRLAFELSRHPDALSFVGDDDASNNHEVYRDVLVSWHNMIDGLESAWSATEEDAAVWVAVIADSRAFFFSEVGLAGHLDTIGFKLEDDEFLRAVEDSRKEGEGE